jgi:hypothetical protein
MRKRGWLPINNMTPSTQTTQAAFDQAYWLAQPPAVQALESIADFATRLAKAMQLATQGYTIDAPIMAWGWDPYLVMTQRQQYGYKWVPSALMAPVTMAPGVNLPGAIAYNANNPPPGAIMVSVNLADYPPFTPPVAPAPVVPAVSLVGIAEGAGYFQAIGNTLQNGSKLTDGAQYSDPSGRGNFIYHQSASPFAPNGMVQWFTQSPATS